jgi:SAM-dependent methyltransferase
MSKEHKKDLLKHIYLKYIIGYKDPQQYWNTRWGLSLKTEMWGEGKMSLLSSVLTEMMKNHDCTNILEVGCGQANLRSLKGYAGLDFSIEALKRSKLQEFIYADISNHIPLPDKTFDAALSIAVLLHIPPNKINNAVKEICRITRKAIILYEPINSEVVLQKHNFNHDLIGLFPKYFDGYVAFMNEKGIVKEL